MPYQVRKLIEVYAKTFRVNFSFKSKPAEGDDIERLESITSCDEKFLVKVFGIHRVKYRLDNEWSRFQGFAVEVSELKK